MDSAEQARGEKQVMDLLIEPLLARGLGKPRGFTKQADFQLMVAKTLCPKLAYMTPVNLAALEEQIAANPDGKGKDQMPIPNEILRQAADIQEPGDEASPLLRAVFAASLGADALAGDWAPELRRHLKKVNRKWPVAREVDDIKRAAYQARAKADDIRARQNAGEFVSDSEVQWLASRDAARRKCEAIRSLALGG
ncbi:hypothetical protein [Ruegeria sp. Ofav3-42]|uniref:hypothetical protein n=1 Tax=Ruegeria sp. Ofav3-42 TaxID=2917759 RepID=UPI001EF4650E|nr:hypothetical protein [Ruegeria sp. Ofav3-42]MCG7520859.1 hypothetical protein [Ruegeria sp. Ofav3-42]